jgi:hypothetical protein
MIANNQPFWLTLQSNFALLYCLHYTPQMDQYFIIDFDSTFTQVEALDELARISLKNHPTGKLFINR